MISTLSTVTLLNPSLETVNAYSPGGNVAMEYIPFETVTTLRTSLVFRLVSWMDAPEIAPPVASVTVPVSAPVPDPWAFVVGHHKISEATSRALAQTYRVESLRCAPRKASATISSHLSA